MDARLTQAVLEVSGLRVDKGGRQILAIEHLAVMEGEVLGLVGPNGAGKTTLLMVMAGLDMGFRGQLAVGGAALDPRGLLFHRRRLGVVLQDPQMLDTTVLANAAAPLRYRGVAAGEARRRAAVWLERLGIAHLASRPARTLSGGERQRLALARALVAEPQLLLLDEPFSSLDAPTRAALLTDLRRLLVSLGITAVVVSHDFTEVLLLAHRVAVLMEGRLRQVGEPREVFSRPADPEVAHLVGMENVWPAELVTRPDGPRVYVEGVELDIDGHHPPGRVRVGVRPEAIVLARDGRGFPGEVRAVVPFGPLVRVEVARPFPLVALIPPAQAMDLGPGDTVRICIPPDGLHVFNAGSPVSSE